MTALFGRPTLWLIPSLPPSFTIQGESFVFGCDLGLALGTLHSSMIAPNGVTPSGCVLLPCSRVQRSWRHPMPLDRDTELYEP
eukprot:564857-Amphidinium_carterae.1